MENEPTNANLSEQIEALARAVAKGFEETTMRFDAADRRFDAIEQRLDRIENEHVRRLEHVELSAVDLLHDVTKLKAHADIE